MASKQSAAAQRAEHAEDTAAFWERIWEDGECDPKERAEMTERLRVIVRGASEQVLEIAFVGAFLFGGLRAQRNPDSRVCRLQREARKEVGEDWTAPNLPDAA